MKDQNDSVPKIPIELIGSVLDHAVRATMDTDPGFAVALQLVSRTARQWLLPIIYEVLVVYWPKRGQTSTPSLDFLVRIATESPTHPIQTHVRHVIINAQKDESESSVTIPAAKAEWHLESIASDEAEPLTVIQPLRLCPRRLFLGNHYGYLAAYFGAIMVQTKIKANDHKDEYQYLLERLEEVQTSWHVRPDDAEEDEPVTANKVIHKLNKAISQLVGSQPERSIHLRIAIGFEGPPAVQKAVRLLVALLRCPGVSVTVVQSHQASSEHGSFTTTTGTENTGYTSESLWESFTRDPDLEAGQPVRKKLIILSTEKLERPDSSIEYAAAVRSGVRFGI